MKSPTILRVLSALALSVSLIEFVACAPQFAKAPGVDLTKAKFTVDKPGNDSDTSEISFDDPPVLLPTHLSPAVPSQPDTPPVLGAPIAPKSNAPPIALTLPDDFTDEGSGPATTSDSPVSPAPSAPPVADPNSAATAPAPSPETPATPAPPEASTPLEPAAPVPPQVEPPQQQPARPPEAAPKPPRITRALVACEKMDAASCPSGVGMLIIRTATWLGQCTVSLIGEQLAITNSHCIPDEIKTEGADCSKNLAIYFPQTLTEAPEKAQCDRIVKFSKIAKEGEKNFALEADFAVFHLSRKVNRKSFQLKRDGLTDGLKLAAYTVDPQSSGGVMGVLKVKLCTARQFSVAAPSFVQNFAPVGSFDGCEIIPGNSGSPAIDRDGFVRALVHATLPGQTMPANGEPLGAATASAPRTFNRMAMLTNIACTIIPGDAATSAGTNAGNANVDCAKTVTADDVVRAAYASSDDKKIEPLANEWLKTAPKEFQFDLRWSQKPNSAIHLLAPQIKCVNDPKAWQAAGANKNVVLKSKIPFYGYVIDLDADYRVRLTPGLIDEMDLTFEFDAQSLAKGGFAQSKATITSRNSKQTTVQENFTLARCR